MFDSGHSSEPDHIFERRRRQLRLPGTCGKSTWTVPGSPIIAEVAGVSVGSLYQYFPSKEALVAAVIDRHNEKIMQPNFSALKPLNLLVEVATSIAAEVSGRPCGDAGLVL